MISIWFNGETNLINGMNGTEIKIKQMIKVNIENIIPTPYSIIQNMVFDKVEIVPTCYSGGAIVMISRFLS